MSSGRIYAKGIHQTFYSLAYLFFALCLLTWIESFFLIIEFMLHVIKPLIISSRDFYAKRARDDKCTETESSAHRLTSPNVTPLAKKVRVDTFVTTIGSDFSMPLVGHGYSVDAKPSSFAHLLEDMLLSQSTEGHSAKSIEYILDDCTCHSFHVSFLCYHNLNSSYIFPSYKIF